MELATRLAAAAEIVGGQAVVINERPVIHLAADALAEFPDYPTGDEVDPLGGARLTGPGAWRYAAHGLALEAWRAGDPELARRIMAAGDLSDAEVDALASHLANGRVAEAEAVIDAR